MAYVPAYPTRINWENEPSDATALNDVNLNKMDYAIYQHDQALQLFDGRISTLEGASYVNSFKGRTGAVTPAQDDYTIDQIKATGTAGQYVTLDSNGKLNLTTLPAYPTAGHVVVNQSGSTMTQRSKIKFIGNVSVTDDSTNDQTVVNITGGGGGTGGHTILNPSGSSMTQRTNLQFTGTGVTVTDNSTDDKTVVNIDGGGSSGHTIKDGDGTAMTAQPNLQFADANVSNDSTNNATVVRNFVDIDWDDWQEVGDNDDTYYRVTDAPLADGNVEVDIMKKLWENPAPTASFAPQNITLSSADYDMLLINFSGSVAWSNKQYSSIICLKGQSFLLNVGRVNYSRTCLYVSDTVYNIQVGADTSSSTDNNLCVPIAIYGIKQKITISLSAIISSVKATVDYSTEEHVVGKWIDGSTLYEKTIEDTGTGARTFSFSSSAINVKGIKEVSLSYSYYVVEPYYMTSSDYWNYYLNYNDRNCYIRGAGSPMASASTFRMTLRYTKTS